MRTLSSRLHRTLLVMVTASLSSKSQEGVHADRTFAGSSRPLVLVVEDHEDTRYMLKYMLGISGFDVAEAENGVEAVELAERLRPGLILMDGSLPRLDGLSATRRVREMAALRDVPIVFLSGHAEPSAQAKAFEAGCDDYLVKPVNLDQLVRVLAQHLSAGKPGGAVIL